MKYCSRLIEDTNPQSFIFTELAFPPAPIHALTASSAPFNAFLSTIKKRAALRTPALDDVLVTLESYALGVKQDIQGLPKALYSIYGRQVEQALRDVVSALQSVLEGLTKREEGKTIEAVMLVGRVGIYLAKQSTFFGDIVGESAVVLGEMQLYLKRCC